MNPFVLFNYFNVLLSPFSKLVEEPEAHLLLAYSVLFRILLFTIIGKFSRFCTTLVPHRFSVKFKVILSVVCTICKCSFYDAPN